MQKQHRVPQYHLRFFGDDNQNIGIFNVKTKEDRGSHPIKPQARTGGFYPDQVEKDLGDFESVMSCIHRKVIGATFSKRDLKDLSLGALAQYIRTQNFWKTRNPPESFLLKSGLSLQDFMDALSGRSFSLPYLRWAFHSFLQKQTNSVLLLNKTKNPHIGFITSDVAVGFSDKLLYFDLSRRINHNMLDTCGVGIEKPICLGSPGFLCFYPLSKDRCLLSYNRHTYSINDINNKISISCKQDVRDINRCLLEVGREKEVHFKNIYYDPCVNFCKDHVLKGSDFLEGGIPIDMPIKHIISPAFSFLPVQRKMKDLQTQLYKLTNGKNDFQAYRREVHRKLPSLEEDNFRFSKECFLVVNYSRIIDRFPELFL